MAALYNISYNISVCTCVCVHVRFLIIKKMIPSLFVHQFQSGDNADSYTHNIYCRFFDQPYDACTRLCIGIYGSHLTSTCVKNMLWGCESSTLTSKWTPPPPGTQGWIMLQGAKWPSMLISRCPLWLEGLKHMTSVLHSRHFFVIKLLTCKLLLTIWVTELILMWG